MSVFSFHPVKHVAMGEGGLIAVNDEQLADKLRLFRTHGITNDPAKMMLSAQAADTENDNDGSGGEGRAPWYYEMQVLGYNYRITDIQCALGLSQLKKLDEFLARRREIAARYTEAFSSSRLLVAPHQEPDRESAWHLYMVNLRLDRMTKSRRRVFEELRGLGIGVHVHYIPLHLQPFYREKYGHRRGDFPEAERFYDAALTIPLFPAMSDDDCHRVIESVIQTVA